MTVKAVIFDMDGTIAAFNIDYMAVRAEVRTLLLNAGLPASLAAINESIFEMLKKAEIFLKNNGKSSRTIEAIREKALAIAEKFELEAAKKTTLLPGVAVTLKALKQQNMKLGLCTINSEKSVNYILSRFKIANYFDTLVPRNKVRHVKPHTEHLEMALKALNVKPNEAVVVGDGEIDMKCAKDTGAIAVGISSGISEQKDLVKAGANYIITALTDLPLLIEQLNKQP
ncbi:MAG: HAD family hydrolase [Candidatus Bathyarchaeia archaeon]